MKAIYFAYKKWKLIRWARRYWPDSDEAHIERAVQSLKDEIYGR